jgi:hypothetical protein
MRFSIATQLVFIESNDCTVLIGLVTALWELTKRLIYF